jgi:uncharacterized protein (TIGR02996 family)
MIEREEQEKAAFEKAIAADRYDQATRRVLADWLEEHGLDDEAAVQRAWTPRKQQAEDYLRDFAADLSGHGGVAGDPDERDQGSYGGLTYEELLRVAHGFLDGDKNAGIYFFETPTRVWEEQEKFWEEFEIVTGRKVDDAHRGETLPVSCTC